MKRFTWWRMEENAPHNARERWCGSCSILHHVKRFMSHLPKESGVNTVNGCVPTVNCKGVLKIKVYFARIRRQKNTILKTFTGNAGFFFVRNPSHYVLMKCGTMQFCRFENEFWHFENEFHPF